MKRSASTLLGLCVWVSACILLGYVHHLSRHTDMANTMLIYALIGMMTGALFIVWVQYMEVKKAPKDPGPAYKIGQAMVDLLNELGFLDKSKLKFYMVHPRSQTNTTGISGTNDFYDWELVLQFNELPKPLADFLMQADAKQTGHLGYFLGWLALVQFRKMGRLPRDFDPDQGVQHLAVVLQKDMACSDEWFNIHKTYLSIAAGALELLVPLPMPAET